MITKLASLIYPQFPMSVPRNRSMARSQDGMHFLQGLIVALIVQAAIITLGGVLLVFVVALAPAGLEDNLQAIGGEDLAGNLMVAALIQAIVWGWLSYIRFVPYRFGRMVMYGMGVITLIMFLTVLISIW